MRTVTEIYKSKNLREILKDVKIVLVSKSFVEYLGYGGKLYSLPDFLELKKIYK